ncbi:DUF1080 domain-containing protein [Rhodohalobacter sp. SW132]|nr:DUF1080 domain-containing protein [Rhodohalobacter sp. SW132]
MNQLSEQEIEEGWKLLFDGENADLWRGYNMDRFPQQGWQIENGLLQFQPSTVENQSQGLDIITRETYTDFEFKLEWMVEEGGNSGIFYHVLEQEREIYWSGPEMQILDNENHPDAAQGVDGNRKAGSLYDLIPANPQNTNPFGEWNSIKIVSDGPVVEHWQNGEKVLEYERWTEDWFNMLHESKFQCYPEFGAIRNGHIGLQDHGDIVKFRNIKIREL